MKALHFLKERIRNYSEANSDWSPESWKIKGLTLKIKLIEWILVKMKIESTNIDQISRASVSCAPVSILGAGCCVGNCLHQSCTCCRRKRTRSACRTGATSRLSLDVRRLESSLVLATFSPDSDTHVEACSSSSSCAVFCGKRTSLSLQKKRKRTALPLSFFHDNCQY